jgi:hypothetical protein
LTSFPSATTSYNPGNTPYNSATSYNANSYAQQSGYQTTSGTFPGGYGTYNQFPNQYPTYTGAYPTPYASYPPQTGYPYPAADGSAFLQPPVFPPLTPLATNSDAPAVLATRAETAPSPSELTPAATTTAPPTTTAAATTPTPTTEEPKAQANVDTKKEIPTVDGVPISPLVTTWSGGTVTNPTAPSTFGATSKKSQTLAAPWASNVQGLFTFICIISSSHRLILPCVTFSLSLPPSSLFLLFKKGMYGQWVLPKKALIIACSYPDNRLGAELQNIEPYAVKVYYMLLNTFQLSPDSITVLCDCDGTNTGNTKPTKNNIKQAIQWLTWQTKPGNSLFLYYIGHGGIQPHLNIDTEGIVPTDWETAGYLPVFILPSFFLSLHPPSLLLLDAFL